MCNTQAAQTLSESMELISDDCSVDLLHFTSQLLLRYKRFSYTGLLKHPAQPAAFAISSLSSFCYQQLAQQFLLISSPIRSLTSSLISSLSSSFISSLISLLIISLVNSSFTHMHRHITALATAFDCSVFTLFHSLAQHLTRTAPHLHSTTLAQHRTCTAPRSHCTALIQHLTHTAPHSYTTTLTRLLRPLAATCSLALTHHQLIACSSASH
jgi:hypothetical protein